nr:hypothetical protein [Gemmatimonadota bacterium]
MPSSLARRLLFLLGLIALAGCERAAEGPDPQLVAQWTRTSLALVRSERLGPPVAARISAYAALALHEGYAADVRSGARSFAPVVNGMPEREG